MNPTFQGNAVGSRLARRKFLKSETTAGAVSGGLTAHATIVPRKARPLQRFKDILLVFDKKKETLRRAIALAKKNRGIDGR